MHIMQLLREAAALFAIFRDDITTQLVDWEQYPAFSELCNWWDAKSLDTIKRAERLNRKMSSIMHTSVTYSITEKWDKYTAKFDEVIASYRDQQRATRRDQHRRQASQASDIDDWLPTLRKRRKTKAKRAVTQDQASSDE